MSPDDVVATLTATLAKIERQVNFVMDLTLCQLEFALSPPSEYDEPVTTNTMFKPEVIGYYGFADAPQG